MSPWKNISEPNYEEKIQQKRKVSEGIEYVDLAHKNCVRISSANGFDHELAKFLIAWKLHGKEIPHNAPSMLDHLMKVLHDKIGYIEPDIFITEARNRWNRSRRYDIITLSNGKIFEIETGKSYRKTMGDIIEVNI